MFAAVEVPFEMATHRQLGHIGDIHIYSVFGRAQAFSNQHAASFSRRRRRQRPVIPGEINPPRTAEVVG